MPAVKHAGPAISSIDPDHLYPLQELSRVSGMGKAALRSARAKGLKVGYLGSRAFVRGRDFLEYFDKTSKQTR